MFTSERLVRASQRASSSPSKMRPDDEGLCAGRPLLSAMFGKIVVVSRGTAIADTTA